MALQPAQRMVRCATALIATALVMGSFLPTALAASPLLCRDVEGHQVCVLTIKRSAKNFWEYRVQLSVDGQPEPRERYDCRRTLRSFENQDQPSKHALHQLVCGLLGRR